MSAPDDEPTPLERLLAQVLEQRENGETVDLDEVCAEQPDLRGEVEAALARLDELHRCQREGGPDPLLGEVLAERYRIDESIGAGAMGIVYGALDQRLGRQVAVKVLRRELVVGARMDQRLSREGRVLARINHRHVVTVHDSGQSTDGRSFVVMERLHGCTLGQLLPMNDDRGAAPSTLERVDHFRRMLGDRAVVGSSDVRLVVEWVRQAADGIAAAHAADVVHRDIKPSNLFVDTSGKVVVLDFGIVSVGDAATVGGDGSPLGTPAYMSPEQIAQGRAADVRSDVYGLAATLYHLLSGRPPFAGTIQQVLHAVMRQDPVRADVVRPGLPPDLVAIVEMGMAKEPQHRYPSAAALRDDLLAWLEHRPVSARRASWLGALVRRSVRSPAMHTVVIMLLVGLLGLGAYEWKEARAAERRTEAGSLWARVPVSLVDDLPELRATNALRRDAELARLLDRLVEVADEPGIALALRALHRADGGEFNPAAADLQAIGALEPAPFAAQVAERFAAGRLADDLVADEQAPALGGSGDRALAVLLAMRSPGARPAWADVVLGEGDGLRRHAFFAELRLLLWQDRASGLADEADRVVQFEEIEREALRLEERRGRASAVTLHARGNSLLLLGRVTEARAVGAQAVQQAPTDFVAWLLAGSTALRCHDAAAAVEQLRRACELQPSSRTANRMLCDALVGMDAFREAAEVLLRLPAAQEVEDQAEHERQLGIIALDEFFALQRAQAMAPEDADAVRARNEVLARADAHFQKARSLGSVPAFLPEVLCNALRGEPFSRRQLLELMAKSPLDGFMLGHVTELLPKALDAEETSALLLLLRAQAAALGGFDH